MLESGLDERVARLEGRVDGFDGRFAGLERRLDGLDNKIDRFREELGARIETVETRLAGRIDVLDQKVTRYFVWTTGIQVAVLLAVVAALTSR